MPTQLRRLLESALAAATVYGCTSFGGRSTGPYEIDTVVPLDPAWAEKIADKKGQIDEKTCRRACAGESGDLRSCRLSTRVVQTPAVPSEVRCYRFPKDGSPEQLAQRVPISEEQRASLEHGPGNTLRNCFDFCRSYPGEVIMCTLADGTPATSKNEDVAICHMRRSGSGGGITFGHGRAPEGLVAPSERAALGGYLSRAAYAERASIRAFRILAHELGELGAPSELVDRARGAAREELRHARMMSSLARRRGQTVDRVRAAPRRARTLSEIARENAIEGCVNETFGALVAIHQSRFAEDPELRLAMAEIAEDEIRHAELAWDVSTWCRERLSTEERTALDEAMRRAVEAIGTTAFLPDSGVRRAAGLPDRASSVRMVAALRRTLWKPNGERGATCPS